MAIGRPADIEEAKCCKSDHKCVCPPNAIQAYAAIIMVAILFIGIIGVLDQFLERDIWEAKPIDGDE